MKTNSMVLELSPNTLSTLNSNVGMTNSKRIRPAFLFCLLIPAQSRAHTLFCQSVFKPASASSGFGVGGAGLEGRNGLQKASSKP
jgi:hypothetical protein